VSSFKVCVEDSSFNLQLAIENQKTMWELLSILLEGGFITHNEPDLNRCKWEFHDLLFHTKSRLGMVDDSSNLGGTYRFNPINIEDYNGFKNYQDKKYFQFEFSTSEEKNPKISFFEVLRIRKSTRSFSSDKTVITGSE
jgi:hypothetical protein